MTENPLVSRLRDERFFALPKISSRFADAVLDAANALEAQQSTIQSLEAENARLRDVLKVLHYRECSSWCDRSLGEHTSYCKNASASLNIEGEL